MPFARARQCAKAREKGEAARDSDAQHVRCASVRVFAIFSFHILMPLSLTLFSTIFHYAFLRHIITLNRLLAFSFAAASFHY
jgi:hypothetical protein